MTPLRTYLVALSIALTQVPSALAQDADAPATSPWSGRYIEVSAGFTRTSQIEEADIVAKPASGPALSFAVGSSLSENTRIEAEVSHAPVAWDVNDVAEVNGTTTSVDLNLLFDIRTKDSPVQFEAGIGAGWTFLQEACVELEGLKICADADEDDWNAQVLLGGSYAISDKGAIVGRYRMMHAGGLSSEDRVHVFTVGYRHRF